LPELTRQGELVRVEVPAQPAFVGVARSVVAAVATTIEGIDDDRLEDLRVAVSEACTNAVGTHRDTVGDTIVVRCSRDSDRFSVRIEDTGPGFDPDTVPAPPGPEAIGVASERGWGIQLIRALVDEVEFQHTADGTAVDLVMRLERSA
jgi:serine/threonine-protein kinase RsbW